MTSWENIITVIFKDNIQKHFNRNLAKDSNSQKKKIELKKILRFAINLFKMPGETGNFFP